MYGYYEKIPSFSGFEDTHFKDCLLMMKQLPIYEKLGINLLQLMELDDEEIIEIRDTLTATTGETNHVIQELENKNRKRKPSVKRTGRP